MTKYNSANCGYLLLGKYDLLNITTTLEDNASDPTVETTPFGTAAASYGKPGVKHYEITGHTGWYDDTVGSLDTAMIDLAAGENVFMFAFEGNTDPDAPTDIPVHASCAGGALKTAYKRVATLGDYHKANMELAVSGALDMAAHIVAALSIKGAGNVNGDTEANRIDLVAAGHAAGAAGANVYLACTSLTLGGAADLTVTFTDSAAGAVFLDHTVMTALVAAGAEKKVSTDMTVNRYLACKWVWGAGGGGGTTGTWTLAVKVN